MKIKFIIALLLLISTILLLFSDKKQENTEIILKSYKNTVALYENGVKKEVYEEIVLNTLPEKDIKELNVGIIINSNDELLRILEDFDG